jgi:rhomboid protease GluP
LIYFCAGAVGFSLSAIVYPMVLSIGASAAIFGLLGFAIVFGRYRGGTGGRALSQYLSRWLIFAAIMLFIPKIDNAAHIGGGLAGALLGLLLDPEERAGAPGEAWVRIFTWVAILATFASFLAMLLAYPTNLRLIGGQV